MRSDCVMDRTPYVTAICPAPVLPVVYEKQEQVYTGSGRLHALSLVWEAVCSPAGACGRRFLLVGVGVTGREEAFGYRGAGVDESYNSEGYGQIVVGGVRVV